MAGVKKGAFETRRWLTPCFEAMRLLEHRAPESPPSYEGSKSLHLGRASDSLSYAHCRTAAASLELRFNAGSFGTG